MRGGKSVGLVLALGLMVAVLASGCAGRQNAVMFGTNTLFGIKVSARDSQTQVPEVKVGYARAEYVWMPLVMSDKDGNPVVSACNPCDPKCKKCNRTDPAANCTCSKTCIPFKLYQGEDKNDGADSYSVLATINGSFNGGAVSGTNGSVAQFFATGLAARKLAEVGGAALVNTKAPAPGNAEAQAKAQVIIARNPTNIEKVLIFVKDASGNVEKTKLEKAVTGTIAEDLPGKFDGKPLSVLKAELEKPDYFGETLEIMASQAHN